MYKEELDLAIRAAKVAGRILNAGGAVTVDSAEGKDIKLSSDKESERTIIGILRSESQYAILSEECGEIAGTDHSGLRWIIDPLDGTANYFKGLKELTCVSIALWKNDEPVLGVVYRYALDELYCGVVGSGAYCSGTLLAPSGVDCVRKAVIATGFPVHRDYGTESLMSFVQTVQRFKKVRMLGAAAIMGTLVAAGKVDVYYEDHIMLWDVAAAAAITAAAGGEVQIERLEDHMCVCKLFANRALMEDFHAESL